MCRFISCQCCLVLPSPKLKSSELTGAIIGASLLYPEFTSLAGQTLNIIGLPLVVMEYGYSIFPVFFAVPVAALERFLKVRLWDSVQLFMVPLLCVVIVVPLTMFYLVPSASTSAIIWHQPSFTSLA